MATHGSTKGKASNGGKGKAKKGDKGKEKDEKLIGKFEGECRCREKKEHKKAECSRMQAGFAAGRCDQSGKPTGFFRSRRQAPRSFPHKRAMHRVRSVPYSLTATGGTQPSSQSSYAPSAVRSMATTVPMQQSSLCTSQVPLAISRRSSPKPGSST